MKAQSFGSTYGRGVSTLEILIAFAILFLAISALIIVVFGNQSIAIDTETNTEALSKAQTFLEQSRALSRSDFTSVQTSPSPIPDDIYKKSITVIDIDPSTKQVTSYVSWPEGGRELYVKLSTILTDWFNPADKCSPTLSGDWTKPRDWKAGYGYADIPSNTGATGVAVHGTKVYLTSDPSAAGKEDFYVIDASNPKPPGLNLPIIGKLKTTYGLTGVQVSGLHAFVSAHSAEYQILVIDISNAPSLSESDIVTRLDVVSDSAYGNTLTYDDKKIYLGLTKSTGPEFRIIDVSDVGVSNPPTLVPEGSFEVGAAVNQILISDDLAYLATASTTPVIVLDISNSSSPSLVDVSSPMSLVLTGQSLELSNDKNHLFLGMIGGSANPKLLSLDASDISDTPSWTQSKPPNSGVYRIVSRNNLLFMTTADPSGGFEIWDVSNPSTPPTRYDKPPFINIEQTSTAGMDCFGNLIFVGQRSNRALQIVGPS